MAYGRLDVYWPDGRLETYMLEEDTISVGRADGNTVALDTETISRYHFSIIKDGEDIRITDLDSANGTYMDGIALVGNQPYDLGDVEEIQVGSLRIIYRKMDDSATVMMAAMEEDTAPVMDSLSLTRISLDATRLDVWPASNSCTSELAITNLSDETRRFTVQAAGIPGEWLRIARPEVELEPEETAYVLLSIKPPRRPNVAANEYTLTVEVTPNNAPEQALQTSLQVVVHTYSGFGIGIAPQVDVDDPISVFLHNQGSALLSIGLKAKSQDDALVFDLPARPVSLQPGQRLRVDIGIQAKNAPFIGA
ncbi:MAG: FHA domain-containing protein, partial [Anaerolineae bacterium]|nr:FHA domain-containing protein [Anaerolineae bacterium]